MRRDFRTVPVDHTLGSSKSDLLKGCDRFGETITKLVAADGAVHGEELERRLVEGYRKAGLPE
jgi:hypothetical protein